MSAITPCDPTLATEQAAPVFDLSQNGLQDLFQYSTSSFGQTSLKSRISRPRGSHLCYIQTHSPAPATTWSSVQTSKTTYIELNSALLYINHSCAPTVEIEVFEPDPQDEYQDERSGEIRVARDRDLQIGDEATYFYPSTEWESPRPFECLCRADEMGEDNKCIGIQRGNAPESKNEDSD
ncbi:MAG: hypothetical protein Q9219_007087 [cf. Caloplaca sp. 3 TL-2023]